MIPRALETDILRLHQTEHWPIGSARCRSRGGYLRSVRGFRKVDSEQGSGHVATSDE